MPNFQAIKIIQKALNDIKQNRNISNGMFVFVCSSHHLEWEPFPYLVVIVTTLQTPKNILKQLKTSLVLLYSRTYVAGIRRNYHESSDCFEYPNQATKKNTCQNFPTHKNPKIENFKRIKILRSFLSLEIQRTPLVAYLGSPISTQAGP